MRPRQIADALNRSSGVLEVKLRDFLSSGDPASTQGLRRAVRRLRTVYAVLPRRERERGRFRRYFRELDALSKGTGEVRDLDTVLARVAEVSNAGDWRSMAAEIARMRAGSLRSAAASARRLAKMKAPEVKAETLSGRKMERRLEKRKRRVESRLDKEFDEFLATQEIDAMHALRKDSRRLRHLLELEGGAGSERLLKHLRSIQDDLGIIRDHDLVIEYLRGRVRIPSSRAIVREEIARRHAGLEDFMTKYRGQARAIPA